jgi:hypothetical protein
VRRRGPQHLTKQTRRPAACASGLGQTPDISQVYSITVSARVRKVAGKSSPSVFAVFKLTTSSNTVGCSTGRSLGFAPRISLTNCLAICWYIRVIRGPYARRPPSSAISGHW